MNKWGGDALRAHSRTERYSSWRVKRQSKTQNKSKVCCVAKLHRLPAVNWHSLTHARASFQTHCVKKSRARSATRAPAGSRPNTECHWHQHDFATLFSWTPVGPNAGWLTNRKQIYRGISVDLICHLNIPLHNPSLNASKSGKFDMFFDKKSLRLLCKKQTDTHWETLFLILDEICICSVYVWACLGF